ncbi:hypothetical protein [Dyella caseinilytica]|uniref:Uncharacterized protein n=1 Tax=Dyella caseinilytica TaxID=1849581 RepID=A0ABX7GNT0_9GAMM|nr:hypothetical protein [Dyella caseinilytica]QRN51974.1 hypothetical protein ISN74_10635 [Dyella caseinilytica]GGA04047.1 hypothetical protein GCM10011408_27080 [Dyella caseinilytica]
MKHYLLTATILIAALVFYAAGMTGYGAALFMAGIACECWFWMRILRRHGKTPSPMQTAKR